VSDNKNGFFKYVISKRRSKENIRQQLLKIVNRLIQTK